jgi:hypothetical protein
LSAHCRTRASVPPKVTDDQWRSRFENTVGDGLLVGMSDDFDDVDVERFRDLQQPTDHHRAQGHCKVRCQTALGGRLSDRSWRP